MSSLASRTAVGVFEGLKLYSQAEVQLVNCFRELFSSPVNWRHWFQEGLGELLELPGQSIVSLQIKNQVEPGEAQELKFGKDEISIGRDQANDVVLALPGVGRRHARIIKRGMAYFLEDLGSANGTYLKGVKLNPHEPVVLNEGSRFLVFPHEFTFSSEDVWHEEPPLHVAIGELSLSHWGHEQTDFGGYYFFKMSVRPGMGSAVMGVSTDFLQALIRQISRGAVSHLVPSDAGLFEFVMLSVLERANRDLRFPFRFALDPFELPAPDETGIKVDCVVGISEMTGAMELFLPASLLRETCRLQPNTRPLSIPVSWPVMAICGYADLSLQEMMDLEAGDALLITQSYELVIPAAADGSLHGWRAVLTELNPLKLKIKDYFERRDEIMENQTAPPERADSEKPDLSTLPVRVQIVLSQLEMTLADLNKLTPGSIVEMHRDKSEMVQLAVNGKIAGAGELIEIEGRLGVRIFSWATR